MSEAQRFEVAIRAPAAPRAAIPVTAQGDHADLNHAKVDAAIAEIPLPKLNRSLSKWLVLGVGLIVLAAVIW